MYLHTVGCCQTVNENTPPRLTPAMEIGAHEQAHGKQWNEKWRRVRVKTNERAVLKWNEHKNTTSKSKSKNTTQQTDERKKKSAKQKQNIKHLHSAVAKQQRVAFLFFQCENFHIYTLHVHTNEIAAAPRISPLTICHFHFSPVFIRTHDFFPLLLLLVVIFFFLFFFSFSIYFCLAFCDVAFVCFFCPLGDFLPEYRYYDVACSTLRRSCNHFNAWRRCRLLLVFDRTFYDALTLFSLIFSPLSLSLTLFGKTFFTRSRTNGKTRLQNK